MYKFHVGIYEEHVLVFFVYTFICNSVQRTKKRNKCAKRPNTCTLFWCYCMVCVHRSYVLFWQP